ncbi:NADPH:quinone reductase-like Zn-dependent oxidoreductase [Arthrobacter ginsengisoli]|uniref:NADPH:quinone reductase-like Zn-dependent oxidoreductase n=1 Tax=Arthrobacter ginsengisoli TaxID=1356565 RepID=A0ABU1UG28_9MICC|nr:zinc-binding dehydrogenase [Arthrobacter ginsengisoli]MDR7084153.1 NADPH:quinone reductase-like Zn-dependent oxidoreductase [Arthrobacter ginsengisoli]
MQERNRWIELARVPGDRLDAGDFAVRTGRVPAGLSAGQVRVRAETFGLNAGLKSRLGTGRSTPHLTLLGHVGMTAYAGLGGVVRLREGETVWVSAAAGGVGTCAVQFAPALGARVVASASGPGRTGFLRDELGVDLVMGRNCDLVGQLQRMAPSGLDVYFDSVGGDHLAAAVDHKRDRGRIVLVGNAAGRHHGPALEETSILIRRAISMSGLWVNDHYDERTSLESLVSRAALVKPLKAVATVRGPGQFAGILRRPSGRGVPRSRCCRCESVRNLRD